MRYEYRRHSTAFKLHTHQNQYVAMATGEGNNICIVIFSTLQSNGFIRAHRRFWSIIKILMDNVKWCINNVIICFCLSYDFNNIGIGTSVYCNCFNLNLNIFV